MWIQAEKEEMLQFSLIPIGTSFNLLIKSVETKEYLHYQISDFKNMKKVFINIHQNLKTAICIIFFLDNKVICNTFNKKIN